MDRLVQRAVTGGLIALCVVIVYRATAQSIVYDEAFTYLAFLTGSPSAILTNYTANNHVLFSLMAKASISLFGDSALAMRIPTVISGMAYLVVVFALCRRAFGGGRLFVLGVAALTLNPFVLDFLVAARGYGMALALFMVGFYQAMLIEHVHRGPDTRRWAIVSIALGLSVCANLTFLFPAGALFVMSIATDSIRRWHRDAPGWRRYLRDVATAVMPGAILAAAILVGPLRAASGAHFTYGTDSLWQTALSLVHASFRHGRDAWPADPEIVHGDVLGLVTLWGLIVPVLLGTAVLIAGALRRLGRGESTEHAERLAVRAGGSLFLTLSGLVSAHWLVGTPYPFGRTGLYLIVLFTLTMAGVVKALEDRGQLGARALSVVMLVVLTLVAGRFFSELNTNYFHHWRFDAGTHDIFHVIAKGASRENARPTRVAAAEVFGPSLEFYRVTEPVERISVDSEHWLDQPAFFDYFVVSPDTSRMLERTQPGLARAIYAHPTSGAVLMENLNRSGR